MVWPKQNNALRGDGIEEAGGWARLRRAAVSMRTLPTVNRSERQRRPAQGRFARSEQRYLGGGITAAVFPVVVGGEQRHESSYTWRAFRAAPLLPRDRGAVDGPRQEARDRALHLGAHALVGALRSNAQMWRTALSVSARTDSQRRRAWAGAGSRGSAGGASHAHQSLLEGERCRHFDEVCALRRREAIVPATSPVPNRRQSLRSIGCPASAASVSEKLMVYMPLRLAGVLGNRRSGAECMSEARHLLV